MVARIEAIHDEIARQREDHRRDLDAVKGRVTDLERQADRVDGAVRLTKALGVPVMLLVLKEVASAFLPSIVHLINQGG